MNNDLDLLRAALRKIGNFDFDAGCGVDDMMAFADRAWRGTLDPEEVDELRASLPLLQEKLS